MNDTSRAHSSAIVAFFENLGRADVARLGSIYAPDAWFKDPFNEVTGLEAITRVFEHMFVKLDNPRFKVHAQVVDGQQVVLTWDFLFCFKGESTQQTVRGASHLILGPNGLITSHRDYWDVAEELYEKLPLLGSLMRWLKRRANQ
jgi:limonene-1,2-epoxide hydrolase